MQADEGKMASSHRFMGPRTNSNPYIKASRVTTAIRSQAEYPRKHQPMMLYRTGCRYAVHTAQVGYTGGRAEGSRSCSVSPDRRYSPLLPPAL